MSHGVTSDICENVLFVNDLGKDWNEIIEPLDEGDVDHLVIGMGWILYQCTVDDTVALGKKSRLYSEYKAIKGEHIVYLINSSQYNNVGEFEFTALSPIRADVEEFWVDFADVIPKYSKIEDLDTVEHWS